jgi:hypothetical protein
MLEMKPRNNDTPSASDLVGARRTTGDSLAGKSSVPDPQVVAKPERRRFTSKYKLSILDKADQCTGLGEVLSLDLQQCAGQYSMQLVGHYWGQLNTLTILGSNIKGFQDFH